MRYHWPQPNPFNHGGHGGTPREAKENCKTILPRINANAREFKKSCKDKAIAICAKKHRLNHPYCEGKTEESKNDFSVPVNCDAVSGRRAN